MGGEPTFVSIDDMTSPQWTIAADGPEKRALANDLAVRLFADFAPGGLIQRSQGKWYPGEPLPRWQIGLHLADRRRAAVDRSGAAGRPVRRRHRPTRTRPRRAEQIARLVTARLRAAGRRSCRPCFEDPLAALAGEVGKPEGAPPAPSDDPLGADPDLVSALDADLSRPGRLGAAAHPGLVGQRLGQCPAWRFRRGRLVLLPGDSPGRRAAAAVLGRTGRTRSSRARRTTRVRRRARRAGTPEAVVVDPDGDPARGPRWWSQARDGIVHVFLPPLEKLEKFAELIGLLDEVVREVGVPVVFEGYGPPPDSRAKVLMVTPDPGVIEVNVHPTSSWAELAELTATLYETARQCRLGTETFGLDGRHSGTGGGNHITLGGSEPAKSPLLRRPDLLVSMLTYWQHHPSLSYLFSGRFIGPTSQAPRVDEGRPETLYELEIAFSEVERLVDRPDETCDHRPGRSTGRCGTCSPTSPATPTGPSSASTRCTAPTPPAVGSVCSSCAASRCRRTREMALVQALLVRALLARVRPWTRTGLRWSAGAPGCTSASCCRTSWPATSADVVADLQRHHDRLRPGLVRPVPGVPVPADRHRARSATTTLELRSAIEPWNVLGEESSPAAPRATSTPRSSGCRCWSRGFDTEPVRRHLQRCGRCRCSRPATPGSYVAGVRYKAWKPWSALHPTHGDRHPAASSTWSTSATGSRSAGPPTTSSHPGGRSYDHPPVNAKEAEARRARRFEASGHTTGAIDIDALAERAAWRGSDADDYPLTLDLRRRTPRRWGRG